jgi:CPA1 family monovalent cation:H+ antiporter
MSWNPLDQIALLLVVTAGFAYVNHYVVRLPRNVGLLVLALVVSISLRGADALFPAAEIGPYLRGVLARIDFGTLLLDGVLPFLLFAGAIEIDLRGLLRRKWTILALATGGVAISTALIGFGMWGVFHGLGVPIPLFYCLAFGALISPTDPVTVLAVLQRTSVPERLRSIIAGESLFNDGIGIVLFGISISAAIGASGPPSLPEAALAFLRETGGGAMLGLVTGGIAFLAMRGIDEYGIELIISLALVTGTYGLADTLGVSGPVAIVVAGLIMGSIGVKYAVSGTTLDYLSKFWALVDEVLNALLYLLVGLEFGVVALDHNSVIAALIATALALVARVISIVVASVPLNFSAPHKARAVSVITWSGLRGGISLALVLSMPGGPFRAPLITATYAIVIFTMIVQGLTLRRLASSLYPADIAAATNE